MTEERKSAALLACEKFLRESKWNVQTGLIADFWCAAVEWADGNPDMSNVCSTTGFGDVPIGRRRIMRGKSLY